MFSESGAFCFLRGVSSDSSSVFVSDKDLNGNMDLCAAMKINMDDYRQTSTLEEDYKNISLQERDQEEDNNNKEHHQDDVIISVPVLLPPLKKLKLEGSENEDDDSNEGFKTPTSSDQKIPVFLKCPGAPRKTKSTPAKKRKTCRRHIVLDVSKEFESFFPMPFMVDLCAGGGKNKKVKQCCSGN